MVVGRWRCGRPAAGCSSRCTASAGRRRCTGCRRSSPVVRRRPRGCRPTGSPLTKDRSACAPGLTTPSLSSRLSHFAGLRVAVVSASYGVKPPATIDRRLACSDTAMLSRGVSVPEMTNPPPRWMRRTMSTLPRSSSRVVTPAGPFAVFTSAINALYSHAGYSVVVRRSVSRDGSSTCAMRRVEQRRRHGQAGPREQCHHVGVRASQPADRVRVPEPVRRAGVLHPVHPEMLGGIEVVRRQLEPELVHVARSPAAGTRSATARTSSPGRTRALRPDRTPDRAAAATTWAA